MSFQASQFSKKFNKFTGKTPNSSSKSASVSKKKSSTPKFTISPEYATQICANSYLGKKGYTIPKSILSPDDITFLKHDLFMRPIVAGGAAYGGGANPDVAFPVYRENDSKLYLPRFYGISRYGLPPSSEIEPGEDIDVPFVKQLRDYQDNIIGIYTKHVDVPIHALPAGYSGEAVFGGGAILEVPCGRGKCLAKDTPVVMFDGTIRSVQDINIGDVLMGDDSTARTVLTIARGRERMYSIEDVSSPVTQNYIVNESHILSLKHSRTGKIMDVSVKDYMLMNTAYAKEWCGYRVPLHFQSGILNETNDALFEIGNMYGKLQNQSLPVKYRICPEHQRKMLFWGIICSCGIVMPRCELYEGLSVPFRISIKHSGLFDDIVFVSRTLGYRVTIISNTIMDIDMTPETLMYPINVIPLNEDDYYGFEIDKNRRFVLGDCSVTHNTVMALKIISHLQKKTLILVHKEFLMNQWIERIAEFVPSAKVGKIQGQIFDVSNKDIVIGMIQTLYDKEYPSDKFTDFGLTIIDEVHRIGSEQFSKTLLKIITPYMLGISATVERKDGLTRVLNMFIGDKIYSEDRENDDPVCVRAIEYVSNDVEFNRVECDFRGNPKHSTMISKLSGYVPRNQFIVRVIADLLKEHPDNQIMILAHQRAVLTFFYEAIREHNIAGGSVGYYVGGMKEELLKETESKRIVLATFAMAAEALDIKTLSTLIMATPKTDIIQSVGRILRVKHEHPIVVDIVDKHDVFQKQWIQRRRFYKKCGYRIRQIDSLRYMGMCLNWNTDMTWKWVFEPKNFGANETIESESGEEETDIKVNTKCLIDTNELYFHDEL